MKPIEENVHSTTQQASDQSTVTKSEYTALPNPCEVDAIIRKRVYASVGVGMVPIPLVDLAGLTAIQLELIHALSQAYGVEFRKERAKSILTSLGGSMLTVASVPLFASIFKSLPVIGTAAGAATLSITGAATTYAVGRVFDKHYREGGTLFDFDAQRFKACFKEKQKEGEKIVAKMKSDVKEETAEYVSAEPM